MATARPWMLLLAAAALASTTGCVTQGKYNSLTASYQVVRSQNTDLHEENKRLSERISQLDATRSEIAERLVETREVAAELVETYDELVGELQVEVSAGQIEIQQLIDGIHLNVSEELLFESGSADLHARGREVLARVAQQIRDETAIIAVEGHTDNVAISSRLKARYSTNWELAGARAAVVVRALSESGVDPTLLRAISRGPFAPIAPNDSAQGRAKNRRTEIILRPVPREG
ncbi:MAG: OmpA family protein [Deltaproteobacteria bacterium]|nr:OmpA family protein [Deltaproteobacteria bacterium]